MKIKKVVKKIKKRLVKYITCNIIHTSNQTTENENDTATKE